MDRGGEVAVGLPCIVLQLPHQRVVQRIKFGHNVILPDVVRTRASILAVALACRAVTGQETAERCVIVVDEGLAPGLAANAAAVLALTLGATVDGLVGADILDADGEAHPGLIPMGLPVLGAPRELLCELRARATQAGVGVVDFPVFGQQTNDYEEFRGQVASTPTTDVEYLGLALHGSRRAVSRGTGTLRLLGRPSPSASRAA